MADPPSGEFDAMARRVSEIAVDVTHLEKISDYLKGVASMVPHAQTAVDEATKAAHAGTRSSLVGSTTHTSLGYDIPVADEFGIRFRSTHTALTKILTELTACLEETAQAVRNIAADHATAEKRNQLEAAEFARYLAR